MAGTQHHSGETVLKAGPKRTVRLVRDGGGTAAGAWRVRKEFHGPGLGGFGFLGAPGDWRRAVSERGALEQALAAGLPVPEPLGVFRTDRGGWALEMKAIDGAQSLPSILQDLLSAKVRHPAEAPGLADRIGGLLRSLENAEFVHADPHPGNVVVDEAGHLWIVDLARSRVGARPDAVAASIVRALSRTRELVSRTFRRRIALAWRGAKATPEWTRRIEDKATRMRIQEMTERVAVWRRTSSATEVRDGDPVPAGLGRSVWVRERPREAPPGWTTERKYGSPDETSQIWETLVRATLHGLPAVHPRALSLGPPHAVEFDLPASAAAPTEEAQMRTRRQLAARGLSLEPLLPGAPSLLAGPDGTALIGPFTRLVELDSGSHRP